MKSENGRPYGVMFHHFHDPYHIKGQGSISADEFVKIIEFIGRKRILSAQDWLERTLNGKLGPEDVCLTFDDGPRCQFEIAYPVMKSMGLTGFWFVYSSVMQGDIGRLEVYRHFRFSRFKAVDDFYEAFDKNIADSKYSKRIEKALKGFNVQSHLKEYTFYTDGDRKFRYIRDNVLGETDYYQVMDAMLQASGYDVKKEAKNLWLDDQCIRKLDSEGHVVGLHSHSHPTRMAECPPERQLDEYRACAEHLTSVLAKKPLTMAHPCNSYSAVTLSILRDLGIKLGFRANMLKTAVASELEFPRADTTDLLKIIHSR